MATVRENELVGRVQKLRRSEKSILAEYTSVSKRRKELKAKRFKGIPSLARIAAYTRKLGTLEKDLKLIRSKLAQAERELARYRKENALSPIQRLAQTALANKNINWENYRTSDGRTAGDDLRELVKRGKVWNAQTQRWVVPSEKPIRLALALAKVGRDIRINAFLNGTHSGPGSSYPSGTHPLGRGLDIGFGSDVSDAEVRREVEKLGGYYLKESATNHWHASFRN